MLQITPCCRQLARFVWLAVHYYHYSKCRFVLFLRSMKFGKCSCFTYFKCTQTKLHQRPRNDNFRCRYDILFI